MKNQGLLLSVDQSTQATKSFIFDANGKILSKISIAHKQFYPQSGYVEHDPLEILNNVQLAVSQVLELAGHSANEIVSLSFTNQRETVIVWDAFSGEPLSNAIVWQDTRGSSICEQMGRNGQSEAIRESTGLLLDPYFSAPKLRWLVSNNPAARASLLRGRLMAGNVDSWLIWNLTQRQVFATDYSNASRTMLLNIRSLSWDGELIKLFGLEGILLPEVRSSDASFGSAHIKNLNRPIPIRGVLGDSHAALFGHRGWTTGATKGTYGTGSSIMQNIGSVPCLPPKGIMLSLGWGFKGIPTYVFEGNIHSTGYTLRWLRENLGIFKTDNDAEKMATDLPDNGGVYIVPAFSGLGAPWWKANTSALITGLSYSSDKRNLARAGLESIAYQIMDLIDSMNLGSQMPLKVFYVDGGPTKNRFLMQFQADMLKMPVIVPENEDLSALGAAFMGGLSAGVWHDMEEIDALCFSETIYSPLMGENERSMCISGWKSAVIQAISRENKYTQHIAIN